MEYTILLPNETMKRAVAAMIPCIALDTTDKYDEAASYIFISLCDVDEESLGDLASKYKEVRILKKCSGEAAYNDTDKVKYFDIDQFYDYVPVGKTLMQLYVMEILLCHQFGCCYKSQNATIDSNTLGYLEAGAAFNGVTDDLFSKLFESWDGLRTVESFVADGKLVQKYERMRLTNGKIVKVYGGFYKLVPGSLPWYKQEYINCIGHTLESSTHMVFEFYDRVFESVREVFQNYKQCEYGEIIRVTVPVDHLSGIFDFEVDDIIYKEDGAAV